MSLDSQWGVKKEEFKFRIIDIHSWGFNECEEDTIAVLGLMYSWHTYHASIIKKLLMCDQIHVSKF